MGHVIIRWTAAAVVGGSFVLAGPIAIASADEQSTSSSTTVGGAPGAAGPTTGGGISGASYSNSGENGGAPGASGAVESVTNMWTSNMQAGAR